MTLSAVSGELDNETKIIQELQAACVGYVIEAKTETKVPWEQIQFEIIEKGEDMKEPVISELKKLAIEGKLNIDKITSNKVNDSSKCDVDGAKSKIDYIGDSTSGDFITCVTKQYVITLTLKLFEIYLFLYMYIIVTDWI